MTIRRGRYSSEDGSALLADEEGAPSASPPTRVEFRAKRLIDGTSDRAIIDASVVVEDRRIVHAGQRRTDMLPGSVVVDLHEDTILPGLIDAHAHPATPEFTKSVDDPARCAVLGVNALARALEAGGTTMRDCGSPFEVGPSLRDSVDAGLLPGPALLSAGMPVCTTGGHGHLIGWECDGPDEVRRRVRALLKGAVDFIKITGSGGGTPPTRLRASRR